MEDFLEGYHILRMVLINEKPKFDEKLIDICKQIAKRGLIHNKHYFHPDGVTESEWYTRLLNYFISAGEVEAVEIFTDRNVFHTYYIPKDPDFFRTISKCRFSQSRFEKVIRGSVRELKDEAGVRDVMNTFRAMVYSVALKR